MPLIDVHQHVIPDVYKRELATVGVLGSGENPWPAWSLKRQLELMDENGIDAVLMSIASPGAYFGDVEFTKRLVKVCNETMMQMVADHPGKFGAMGFVSLPDVEAACRDVEYALDVLKKKKNLRVLRFGRTLPDELARELRVLTDELRISRQHAGGDNRVGLPHGVRPRQPHAVDARRHDLADDRLDGLVLQAADDIVR